MITGSFNRFGIIFLCLFSSISAAFSQTSSPLFPIANFSAGTSTGSIYSIASGDLNNDGNIDIVSATFSSNNISVLLGNGLGNFGTAVNYAMTGSPRDVVLGDLNNDNNLDVVTTGSGTVQVRLGNGSGGFGSAVGYSMGGSTWSVALKDLNHDGFLDCITPNLSSNTVSVALGSGSGSFGAAATFPVPGAPNFLSTADMNGDGHQDIVTSNRDGNSISVLLGNGFGLFGGASVVPLGVSPSKVRIADFNEDGKNDVVAANIVLFGSGNGGFSSSSTLPIAASSSVAVSDFNNDGHKDIISSPDEVLFGNGAGSFSPSPFSHVVTSTGQVTIDDFNNDGLEDLAIPAPRIITILGKANGAFEDTPRIYVGGASPYQVLLRDLNYDGKLDLITLHDSGLSVSRGLGNGTFGNPAVYAAGGNVIGSAVVVDINWDSKLDIVATTSDQVAILLGNGNGTFGTPSYYPLGPGFGFPVYSVAVGDFNSDGLPDIAGSSSGGVSVIFKIPFGGYTTPTTFSASGTNRSIMMLDVNKDGRKDLVFATEGSPHRVTIMFGNGLGGVSSTATYTTGNLPFYVTLNDLNNDGNLDMIAAVYFGSRIEVRFGNNSGGFGAATNYSAFGPRSVAIGDMNGDGKKDLIIPNFSASANAVRYGDGTGNFGPPFYYGYTSENHSAAVGDLNLDGNLDIVNADYYLGSSGVTIILGRQDSAHGKVFLGTDPEAEAIPMSNVQVEALDPGSLTTVVASTLTNSNGQFRFSSIPNGNWIIRASVFHTTPSITQISNYPDFNPQRTWTFLNGDPVSAIQAIRFPNPLVMQGGLWAGLPSSPSSGTWATAITYLSDDPALNSDKRIHKVPAFLTYPHYTYDDDASDVSDHDANGRLLSNFIDNIGFGSYIDPLDRSKVKFNIIAHSMGGLMTRAMVTQHPPQSLIQRIVNLDSPHGGTTIAWPLKPGLQEVPLNGIRQTSCGNFMKVGWNASHIEPASSDRSWLLYSSTWPTVTPDDSAFGKGRTWIYPLYPLPQFSFPDSLCQLWVTHGWEVTVSNTHSGIHQSINRLRESGLYLSKGILPPQNPALAGPVSDPTEGLGFIADTATATIGANVSRQVHFDTNSIVYGRVILEGESAQFSLTDSTGAPVTISNLQTENISSTHIFSSFEITAPPTGIINVSLQAGTSAAELNYSFYFANGITGTSSAPLSVASGSPVQIRSSILDQAGSVIQGTSGAFLATVVSPSASSSVIPLFDDGLHGDDLSNDGVFGAVYSGAGTSAMGYYQVNVHGVQSLGGNTIERSSFSTFTVNATGATFSGPIIESRIDTNDDDRYDWLNFDQSINFTNNGVFGMTADLVDSTGAIITALSKSVENTSGTSTSSIRLSASGPTLTRHNVAGPWTLKNIQLLNIEAGSLPVSSKADHVTANYPLATFDAPLPPEVAALTPNQGLRAGGYDVMIMGRDFIGTTSVRLCDRAVSFVVQDNQSIKISVPRARPVLATACLVGQSCTQNPPSVTCQVKVTTPWGFSETPEAFVYTQ